MGNPVAVGTLLGSGVLDVFSSWGLATYKFYAHFCAKAVVLSGSKQAPSKALIVLTCGSKTGIISAFFWDVTEMERTGVPGQPSQFIYL